MGILMETSDVNLGRGYRLGEDTTMGTPGDYYADTFHTIAINTRETEFGSIVEPIPIMLKAYKYPHGPINGYSYPQTIAPINAVPRFPEVPSTSVPIPNIYHKEEIKTEKVRPPPKKKWIKEYLEEEPKSPVIRSATVMPVTACNGIVNVKPPSPVIQAPALEPVSAPAPHPAPLLDFAQEHSRPRTTSNTSHGPSQIPSPPSVGSSGSSGGSVSSVPRAGTREVHNKLEKNRRAHLKECFELLKRQLPATSDDKKTSNLSILGSAIRYIQVLRRKERECEHEMERLAREKIAAQQRLAALKRDVSVRTTVPSVRPRSIDSISEEKDREEPINGQVLGIPISITSSPPRSTSSMESSPPHTLNLSTKLRTLPIQLTPTTSQMVRSPYGSRHNAVTLTTLAATEPTSQQNGHSVENGVTSTLNGTLVHPAQIHLPLSQVVGSGGLVVGGAALQLLSSAGLRVLHAPALHHNGVSTENNRVPKENGVVSPTPVSTEAGSVVVSGLAPLVVSQPTTHLLQTHTLTHKMVETQMVKGSVAPLTVSAQYLSATTIVKPVVVVSAPSAPHT